MLPSFLPVLFSYVIGPDYTTDPASEPCIDCERGVTFDLYIPFKDSAYYNCDPEDNPTLMGNCSNGFCGQMDETEVSRHIRVWIPSSYNDGDETAVMVALDGDLGDGLFDDELSHGKNYGGINILENLMGLDNDERSLPSFIVIAVAVNVGSLSTLSPECGNDGGSERYNQYEVMSDKYARYVDDEVFSFVTNHPEIKSKYPNLRITDDPAGRAAHGCSHGGVAALKMAFFRPDLFGIVIAYSTTLVYFGGNPEISESYPLGNADFWVPKPEGKDLIRSEPKKDIRIFHSAGDRDLVLPPPSEYGDWAVANNETAKALTSMGYETRYAYGLDAYHCDESMMRQDMANSMVWAWAKWKHKQAATTNGSTEESPAKEPPTSGSSHFGAACVVPALLFLLCFVS